MPTLKSLGGPARARRDCGCESGNSAKTTLGPSLLPTPPGLCPPGAGNDPLEGNVPITTDQYRCAISPMLQAVADRVRSIAHTMGHRPYRVFLVWQERDRDMVWREACKLELTPVEIVDFDNLSWRVTQQGANADGNILLREVSPRQVTDDMLHGWLNGVEWGYDTADREFFYEVVLHEFCDGEVEPRRRRFVLGAEPFYDSNRHGWTVTLVDQDVGRARDGRDASIEPDQRLSVDGIIVP